VICCCFELQCMSYDVCLWAIDWLVWRVCLLVAGVGGLVREGGRIFSCVAPNGVAFLAILVRNRVWFLHSSLKF